MRCAISVWPASRCRRTRSSVTRAGRAAGDAAVEVRRERARCDQRVVAAHHRRERNRRTAGADRRARTRRGGGEAAAGWLFTLDAPNYQAVMMHAEHEPLRREFYHGWTTRASEQGQRRPLGQHRADGSDSRGAPRSGEARRLPNYAEYSLATKMASSVAEVRAFLEQLAAKSRRSRSRSSMSSRSSRAAS